MDRAIFRWGAVVLDVGASLAALGLARLVRLNLPLPLTLSLLPERNFRITWMTAGIAVAIQVAALAVFGFYSARVRLSRTLGRFVLYSLLLQLMAFTTVLYFLQFHAFPRTVLLLYLVFDGALLLLFRVGLREVARSGRRGRVLIVGEAQQGKILAEAVRRHAWAGVEIAGTASPDGADGTAAVSSLADLDRLIADSGCDAVVFAPEERPFRDVAIEHLAESGGVSLWVLPSAYETLIGRLRFQPLGELPLLEVRASAPSGIWGGAKRLLDVTLASSALIILAPFLLLATAAIRLLSGPPVFYAQRRVGRGGEIFRLWKLRTMRPDAEAETGAVLASREDPRVTRLGRILRAARIDEIPQLWNVVRGEMSLVGPRPERPEFVGQYEKEIAGYGLRHAVRPGLTGLAQISGEYETHPRIKLRYDLAYINNWSFPLDIGILVRTLPVILTRRGI